MKRRKRTASQVAKLWIRIICRKTGRVIARVAIRDPRPEWCKFYNQLAWRRGRKAEPEIEALDWCI